MLFGWLISNKILDFSKKPVASDRFYASRRDFYYKYGLVDDLKNEHRQLLDIYSDIYIAAEQINIGQIDFLLQKFLTVFNDHALKEYTNLYKLLDHSYVGDESAVHEIKAFKLEMQQIGKTVRKFCHAWRARIKEEYVMETFLQELAVLGDVLSKRVAAEETHLYPMYQSIPEQHLQTMAS